MESRKKQKWSLMAVSISSLVYASCTYFEHDCEIEKAIKGVSIQAETHHDLSCDHKSLVIGLSNTVSGDQVGCFLNDVING
jgi:hypothetical protein